MRRRDFLLTIPTVGFVTATSLYAFTGRAFVSSGTVKQRILWRDDLDAARDEAEQAQKPLLILFKAKWCPHCRKFESAVLTEPTLITFINNRFIPIRFDLDEHHRNAEILQVNHVPCTIGLSANADLLGKIVGYVGAEAYRESLNQVRDLDRRLRERK